MWWLLLKWKTPRRNPPGPRTEDHPFSRMIRYPLPRQSSFNSKQSSPYIQTYLTLHFPNQNRIPPPLNFSIRITRECIQNAIRLTLPCDTSSCAITRNRIHSAIGTGNLFPSQMVCVTTTMISIHTLSTGRLPWPIPFPLHRSTAES